MNDACRVCVHGKNCINGRWCDKLKSYVEYKEEIMCDEQKRYEQYKQGCTTLV